MTSRHASRAVGGKHGEGGVGVAADGPVPVRKEHRSGCVAGSLCVDVQNLSRRGPDASWRGRPRLCRPPRQGRRGAPAEPRGAHDFVQARRPAGQHPRPHLQVGAALLLRYAEDGRIVAFWKVAIIHAGSHSDEPTALLEGEAPRWDLAAPHYGAELVLRTESLHLLGCRLALAAHLPRHQSQRREELQQDLLVEAVQGLHGPRLHRVGHH
mmetsp:Transcript_19778/g.61901  ORF Transcript_19778/g.61901 Transcript_19778/m.61901 type:complete len:211 (-) Transcript_19778:1123-1755(-)